MLGLKSSAVPKLLLLLVGVTFCLPIATAKDEHQRSSASQPVTHNGAAAIQRLAKSQGASFQVASRSADFERPLIATLDVVKLSPENVLYLPARSAGDEEFAFVEEAAGARPVERFGLQLPQPDRWSAIAATLALALFFFVRRLV